MDSPDGRLTRRRATVTIWAPEASWACFMTSIDAYLPVPTIRRDENSLPPMTRFVSLMALSPTHRSDDLALVPFPELHRRILAFGRPLAVDRDGREPAVDTEDVEETVHRDARLHHHRIAVDHDLHKHKRPRPFTGAAARLSASCSLRWNYPDQVRGVPGRTRFSGILPPRRQGGVYHRAGGAPGSGERELAARPGHHTRQRALHPPGPPGKPDGRRAHVERLGIAPRSGRSLVAQGAGGVHEAPAHVDDGRVAAAQVLEGSIDDIALALLDRLILHAEARDTAEHARLVRLPVHLVGVAAVRRRADVTVGLGGRRQVVADVGALARDVQGDLLARQCPVRVPGNHPVDDVGVVHRHPDVRLRDLLVEVRRRHRVEGYQELGALHHDASVMALTADAFSSEERSPGSLPR